MVLLDTVGLVESRELYGIVRGHVSRFYASIIIGMSHP